MKTEERERGGGVFFLSLSFRLSFSLSVPVWFLRLYLAMVWKLYNCCVSLYDFSVLNEKSINKETCLSENKKNQEAHGQHRSPEQQEA